MSNLRSSSVTVTIRMPCSTHAAAMQTAERGGGTLADFIRGCILEKLNDKAEADRLAAVEARILAAVESVKSEVKSLEVV